MYYLGIDGGGTKTVYALADENGIIKTLRGLPCNPFDIGMQEAEKRLSDGIREICAGIPLSSVSLFAGLSGGASGDSREKLHAFFASFGFACFDNGSDMDNAVATALGTDDGLCVVIGTGSVIAARKDGKIRRYGGYGYFFDDTLCGFDLGRLAVRHALCVCEGSKQPDVLSRAVLDACGPDLLSKLRVFYEKGKSYIASFAPFVFEAARKQCPSAVSIVSAQAKKLADCVNRAVVCSGYGTPPQIALIGGLCFEEDVIRPVLCGYIDGSDVVFCTEGQEIGALILAKSLQKA